MTRTTIRSEDITAGQVKSADLASDAVDTTGLETDIALLGFKVAANGSMAAYNLKDQTIDAFEDASGVDASSSTGESRNASNYYVGEAASSGNATGGTESTHGSYKVHTFLTGGNLVVPSSGNVSALVVAGGGASVGGGTQAHSAGGGAGGVRVIATHAVTAQTYAVTIGAGGTKMAYNSVVDADMKGKDSVFDTITSTGGGRGGMANSGTDARQSGTSGGSGGGGGDGDASAGSGNTPSTSPSQGNNGGSASGTYGSTHIGSGGGGGAGGAGGAGGGSSPNMSGGDGGDGVQNDYRTGSNVYYGGGGGGAQSNPNATGSGTAGTGGQGGGGTACRQVGNVADGTAGTANTGGGGGGGGYDGGSGIVVIRYTNNQFTTTTVGNLTLVSNATTAETAPTTGDIVMTYTNGAGTATVNTDLKAWISRDNGTTYTQATLSSEGTTGGHTILTAHNVDISSQPSGTSMRYKITTHNQSASKETRIQAVSLGWA